MAFKQGPTIQGKERNAPDGGGVVTRMTQDAIGANIVKAIKWAGQVPMPYQETPTSPAVLAFYCQAPQLLGLLMTVDNFRKTLNSTMASIGMKIYAKSTVPNRASVHSSPAEYKDHFYKEIVFPDGTATYVAFWPDIPWQRQFNPHPPLQLTLGGPNAPSVNSAAAINARFKK